MMALPPREAPTCQSSRRRESTLAVALSARAGVTGQALASATIATTAVDSRRSLVIARSWSRRYRPRARGSTGAASRQSVVRYWLGGTRRYLVGSALTDRKSVV